MNVVKIFGNIVFGGVTLYAAYFAVWALLTLGCVSACGTDAMTKGARVLYGPILSLVK